MADPEVKPGQILETLNAVRGLLTPKESKPKPVKDPGGRPKWEPTEQDVKDVENAAALGLNLEQIAYTLGIHYQTLAARRSEGKYSGFFEALKRGKAKAIVTVTNELYQMATGSNRTGKLGAVVFYLKNVAGWKDRTELSGSQENPIVVRPAWTQQKSEAVLDRIDRARGLKKPDPA